MLRVLRSLHAIFDDVNLKPFVLEGFSRGSASEGDSNFESETETGCVAHTCLDIVAYKLIDSCLLRPSEPNQMRMSLKMEWEWNVEADDDLSWSQL